MFGKRSWAPSPALVFLVTFPFVGAGCAGLFQRARPAVPATYEARARGPLSVGTAEADITPTNAQYLAGFGINRKSTSVHSRLKARAMVLVMGEQRFAIVGLDNLGLLREDADWIKRGLYGFKNGNVLLCSSHTHSAPDLVGMWGPASMYR